VNRQRLTKDVLCDLLTERDNLVKDYGSLEKTEDLVSWTSFFPGGAGVWRGNELIGDALPLYFPEKPYMFVAHNYDGSKSYRRMLKRGWERRNTPFWKTFLAYLDYANIDPTDVFMTNVFMGLRTGKAVGQMEGGGSYFESQCLEFFDRQVAIVQPRMVIVMGNHALNALYDYERKVHVPHPSACRDDAKRADQIPKKVATLVAAIAEMKRLRR